MVRAQNESTRDENMILWTVRREDWSLERPELIVHSLRDIINSDELPLKHLHPTIMGAIEDGLGGELLYGIELTLEVGAGNTLLKLNLSQKARIEIDPLLCPVILQFCFQYADTVASFKDDFSYHPEDSGPIRDATEMDMVLSIVKVLKAQENKSYLLAVFESLVDEALSPEIAKALANKGPPLSFPD